MKKILYLLFLCISISAFADKPTYTIHGSVNQMKGIIYLKSFKNKLFYTIDSAKIVNGKFTLTGKVDHPDLFGLTLNRKEASNPYYIFIENNDIAVTINTENPKMTVTGSESQDLFNLFLKNRRGFAIDTFIASHPKSIVAAYILYRYYANDMSADELSKELSQFDTSLSNTSFITEMRGFIAIKQRLEIGKQAIDFTSTTVNGKSVKLSDYYHHYLLLDFWASWCPSCRHENPNLVKAYKKYKSKGFEIFSVSLDKDKNAWVQAIEKDDLTWIHVSDLKFWESTPAKIYAIRNIPANILIDPSGKIIAKNLRGEALEQKLSELMP